MKIYILIIIIIISHQTFAQTIIKGEYIQNKILNWNKSGSPYIIEGDISLSSTTLNIYDADIIIKNGSIGLYNNSVLNGDSFSIENFNNYSISSFDSKVFINNLNINSNQFIQAYNSNIKINNLTSLYQGNKDFISIHRNSDFIIENSLIENYLGNVFSIYNPKTINVKYNEFINNKNVFNIHSSNGIYINNNDFENNKIAIETYNTLGDFENNFFDKDYIKIYPDTSEIIENDKNILAGSFVINNFSKIKNIKKQEICCSNIMFLPGLMGSRLYTVENKTENQLWEPNRNLDVKKLYLDQDGQSVNNVYTKDIISKTNILGGLPNIDKNIYKDFDIYLQKLKTQKIINNYNNIPYDWRMSADIILNEDIKLKDKNLNLIESLKDLQKNSKTGKVTIVTHSNGGLVAKQLLLDLQKEGLENIVDKIIFVAMPEYGTAQAITSLLFGHNQSLAGGLIMRSSIARELGKNMPTAYTLLPSDKYYQYNTNSDKILQETVIRNYSRINNNLLNNAKNLHENLDNIVYPENIKTYQIVGVGVDTLSDIYMDNKNMFKIIPRYNKAGDGVVQDLYYSREGDQVLYIDLKDTVYKHVNIMNNDQVISNINNIINPPKYDIPKNGFNYDQIIKNNNYKLLKISSSNPDNKLLEYLTPLEMDLSIGMSKVTLDQGNTLYLDKYNSNISNNFREVFENSNKNRFEEYENNIFYLYNDNMQNFSLKSENNNIIDISLIESIDGEITELEYKNIQVFKGVELNMNIDNNNSLNILLPTTNNLLKMNSQTDNQKLSFDEQINKVISEIKLSNIEIYLKDRYIRRLEVYRQNKDLTYLDVLKKRVVSSINSINSLTYSPVLKVRYSRLKEHYFLLHFLLLKL